MRHVPINVAIVIPDMGLLLFPTSPTIRLETVTKKNPKTTTSTPMRNFCKNPSPGTTGSTVTNATSTRLPTITTLKERSRSVRAIVDIPFSFNEAKLSLNELAIVGNVFKRVINPPAATAPAPICFM
jgi:hypothetical protein